MTVSHETGTDAAPTAPDAIEVVLHVARPIGDVWTRLTQREGIEAFLGAGAMLGGKGDPWRAEDGTHGVTRSYHPEELGRVSWHADEHAPATMVDLQMRPEGQGTLLTLRHEHLPPEVDREALRARWGVAMQGMSQA
jgi:uncharacterized protein YndB with AHSA1/START domain